MKNTDTQITDEMITQLETEVQFCQLQAQMAMAKTETAKAELNEAEVKLKIALTNRKRTEDEEAVQIAKHRMQRREELYPLEVEADKARIKNEIRARTLEAREQEEQLAEMNGTTRIDGHLKPQPSHWE